MTDDELTEKIIACAFRVHKALGQGFSERVYENAMRVELVRQSLKVRQQVAIQVTTKEKSLESSYPIYGSKTKC
jgi:GxxExxY protein